MADIAVTAASVVTDANPVTEDGTAGATITAGQLVYKDASDSNKWKLADTNLSAAAADSYGVALASASPGQPLRVQISGDYNAGATLTVGSVYVVSATAGGIAPVADLATGHFTKIWGVAKTAAIMAIINRGAGVARP